jgi:hypothetical protein
MIFEGVTSGKGHSLWAVIIEGLNQLLKEEAGGVGCRETTALIGPSPGRINA